MKSVIAIVIVAGCATPHAAALQPPLDSLGFYVGSWQCKGTSHEPKEEHWDARVVVEPELGGTSLRVEMIGPGDNHTAEHKGYDPATKTWHHVAVGNDGSWAALSSKGWDGARMVFTNADGTDDHTVTTFTKRGDRAYSHAVTRGDAKVWEKECTKS